MAAAQLVLTFWVSPNCLQENIAQVYLLLRINKFGVILPLLEKTIKGEIPSQEQ